MELVRFAQTIQMHEFLVALRYIFKLHIKYNLNIYGNRYRISYQVAWKLNI